MKRKTTKEFSAQLSQINPNIHLIGEYINGETVTQFQCNRCGRVFETAPKRALRGVGCQHCDRKRYRRSHSDFIKELKEINPKIDVIGEYKNHQTKVKCKCLIDNHEWFAYPQNLLRGHGCPKCSAKQTSKQLLLTHAEFMDKFNSIGNSDVNILSDYTGWDNSITCSCKVCGNVWGTKASNLLKMSGGTGCPNFRNHPDYIPYNQKSRDEFIGELRKVNPNIKVIGDYVNTHTPVICSCNKCGKQWSATPSNLLRGTACPQCRKSKGETIISNILLKLDIQYEYQYTFDECKHIRTLPFDFYLPKYNICLEFDGAQHYKPVNFGGCSNYEADKNFRLTQKRDHIKDQFCKSNDITLVRIPYYELENAETIIISKIIA